MENLRCSTFGGDPDLYGLGIRAAYYIQWVTIVITYCFGSTQMIEAINANCIFQLAMLLGSLYKAATSESSTGEVFIVIILGVGGGLASLTAALAEGVRGTIGSSRLAALCRLCLLAAYSAFGIWFWFVGISTLPLATCQWHVFFFSKTSIHGYFKVFSRVLLPVFLFANLLRLLHLLLGAWVNRQEIRSWFVGQESPMTWGNANNGDQHHQLIYHVLNGRYVQAAVILIAFGIFIAMVEVFLRWNSITGVNNLGSPGQLIPFVVAIASIIEKCYNILVCEDIRSS
ncbi:hypothetical protein F5Y10DRAFT_211549 [Nemania abortiva]|nr:hypothetical protein F5Y10DRAFT_211549 [Nemania abortiva]